MGQHPSHHEPPSPITTREELHRECHRHRDGPLLSPVERKWFDIVFDRFSSSNSAMKCDWTQSDLLDFLSLTFPDELKPVLVAAFPILYRCFIGCGSYPWQNLPLDKLTSPVLRAAVVFLVSRDSIMGRFEYGGDHSTNDPSFRVILFQSIATIGRLCPTSLDISLRSEADDKHLLQAMHDARIVSKGYHPNNKPWVKLRPLPPATKFPSSWSQKLDQKIPALDLFNLLKLLLYTRLHQDGIRPEDLAKDPTGIEEVTASVFNAFQLAEQVTSGSTPSTTLPVDISWDSFDYVIRIHIPYLFSGFLRLSAPFIIPGSLPAEQLRVIPRSDLASAFRGAYRPAKRETYLQTVLFTDSVLSQLALFPPNPISFRLTGMSRIYSSNGSIISSRAILRAIYQPGHDRILLVSGSQLPTIGDKVRPLCFGVYFEHDKIPLPPGVEECATRRPYTWNKFPIVGEKSDYLNQPAQGAISRIFQCKPVHRVYQPLGELYGQALLEEDGNYASIKFHLRTEEPGEVYLRLDENGQFGTFTTPGWLGGKKVPEGISNIVFQVENAEILELGSKHDLERTFYIPKQWFVCEQCGGLKGDGVTCNRNALH